MKKRNLSAKKKTHKFLIGKLKDQKIKKIFYNFEKCLDNFKMDKFCIAVSGGPDSMALAYLAKSYSIKNKIKKIPCFIVDHKLRKESTVEAESTKKILEKFDLNCKILTWKGRKYSKNIQSVARNKRYELIFKECLKKKINFILTAHHKDDLYENFFIRILRGSGLKGLSSFGKVKSKINKAENIYVLRPLLNISKKDLLYITKKIFNFSIIDSSNSNEYFLRVRIRKVLNLLEKEGLNFNKFKITLDNLYKSNLSVDYYVDSNIKKNSKFINNQKILIINKEFFNNADEIVFRSFSQLVHKFGNKKNYARGTKITNLVKNIQNNKNFKKMTLSGCIFEKVNNSIIISREI